MNTPLLRQGSHAHSIEDESVPTRFDEPDWGGLHLVGDLGQERASIEAVNFDTLVPPLGCADNQRGPECIDSEASEYTPVTGDFIELPDRYVLPEEWEQIKSDRDLKGDLIEELTPTVVNASVRLTMRKLAAVSDLQVGITEDEVKQSARIFLSYLIENFSGQGSFYAFAMYYMKVGLARRVLRESGISLELRNSRREIHTATDQVSRQAGTAVDTSDPLVAEALGIKRDVLIRKLKAIQLSNCVHLSRFEDEPRMQDQCEGSGSILSTIAEEDFRKIIAPLPKQAQIVFELTFIDSYTREEIGELMDLTRQRISQIYLEGLNNLKEGEGTSSEESKPTQPLSAGFFRLLWSLRCSDVTKPCTEGIMPFIDGPDFFGMFVWSDDDRIKPFRDKLYKAEGGLGVGKLPFGVRRQFGDAILARYGTADGIMPDKQLAAALGVRQIRESNVNGKIKRQSALVTSPPVVAKACFELNVISSEIPQGQGITAGNQRTFYLNEDVVGREDFLHNLPQAIATQFPNLDAVTKDNGLTGVASLLELPWPTTLERVATTLVSRKLISPEISRGYNVPVGRVSHYFSPNIVGVDQAEKNLRIYIRSHFRTLDDVVPSQALASALGVKDSLSAIIEACVARGYLSPTVPWNYSVKRENWTRSPYFNAVLGEAHVEKNIRRVLQYNFRNLDEVTSTAPGFVGVTSLLKLPCRTNDVARFLLEKKILSSEIPSRWSLNKGGDISAYLDPEVVGAERANLNLKIWFLEEKGNNKEIPVERSFVTALNKTKSEGPAISLRKSEIEEELRRRGWLPTAN